jgi:allophanate hydrolase subunit 2
VLTIVRVAGLATVQDLGRPGRMHEAVPPGGALVPELLVAANRRARNRDDAPAIEIFGQLVVRAADVDVAIATPDAALVLDAGAEHAIDSHPRRVAYLAIRGGVHAPLVLGGRGALLAANIGRALRTGDAITSENDRRWTRDVVAFDDVAPLHMIAGPDLDAFGDDALAILAATPYRVLPASDRVGTRLAGPPLPRRAGYAERSRPMVRGAIEVPRDGAPIVLGPDHPTTGGYPIIAVIAHADLGRCFAVPVGGLVRFTAS